MRVQNATALQIKKMLARNVETYILLKIKKHALPPFSFYYKLRKYNQFQKKMMYMLN